MPMISWPSCGCLVVIISSIFWAIEEDAPVSLSGDWLRFLILMYAVVASATGGIACSRPLSPLTGMSSAKAALQPQQKNKRRRGVIGTKCLFTGSGYRRQDTGARSSGVQE